MGERIAAYCWKSGDIEFAPLPKLPGGCMVFAISGEDGPEDHDEFKAMVSGKARHSYDGKTLLVPGVPEVENELEAVEAFYRWSEWAFPKSMPYMVLASDAQPSARRL
jgi:hypothetical protein